MVTTRTGAVDPSEGSPEPCGPSTPDPTTNLQGQVAALTRLLTNLVLRDEQRRAETDPTTHTANALTQMTAAVTALAQMAQQPRAMDHTPEDLGLPLETPEDPVLGIVVADPRFESLFDLESYRLVNLRRQVSAAQIAGLTKRAQDLLPRISKLFDGRGAFEIIPFLIRLKEVENEAGLSEGMVLRLLPDMLLEPVVTAFRSAKLTT